MIKLNTYSQTYELPFSEDYECNFAIYSDIKNVYIFRFFEGDMNIPWNSAINTRTILSFTHGHGILYLSPSLNIKLNGIFLDIIEHRVIELGGSNTLIDLSDDVIHIVLSEKMPKCLRENKIKYLIE